MWAITPKGVGYPPAYRKIRPGFDLAPMFPGCTLMVLPVSGALNIPFGIEPVSTIPGMCGLDTLFAQAYYIDPGTFDLGLSQPIEILFGRL